MSLQLLFWRRCAFAIPQFFIFFICLIFCKFVRIVKKSIMSREVEEDLDDVWNDEEGVEEESVSTHKYDKIITR